VIYLSIITAAILPPSTIILMLYLPAGTHQCIISLLTAISRLMPFIAGPLAIYLIQLMVYGRILYNNIKEYTPKWFPTIPYSQTVKPVFGNRPVTQLGSRR
jgi:predicted neutral ceramidase superfamily lipid hydrolase